MYKVIDSKTWKRANQYEWFGSFPNPCYGMDVQIDVTNIVNYSRNTKTSFFINFIYCLTLGLNSVEELRLRIVNNEIRLYDTINPTFTVQTLNNNFDNGGIIMVNDYKTFYQRCYDEIEEIKNEDELRNGYNTNNLWDDYYITCVRWVDFTSFVHPIPLNKESNSVPRICFGKYVLKDGKYMMMLNITVSHALVDGYPLSCAFNAVKENCDNFINLIK